MFVKNKTKPWEFQEYHFNWPISSKYEVVEIHNPIPLKDRVHWEGVIPPVDTLKVIRPSRGAKEYNWKPFKKEGAFLFTSLARLGEQFSESEVIGFTRHFGLLGIATHWPELEVYFRDCDPLVFVEREAGQAAKLLNLYQAVQKRNLDCLRDRVQVVLRDTTDGPMADVLIDGQGVYVWPAIKPPVTENIILKAVLFYVCKEINRRLEGRLTIGCAEIVQDEKGFKVLPGMKCESLLTAAYVQFRDMVIRGPVLKRCKYCGALFEPSRENQVCCPRLPIRGTDLLEDKPACANRAYAKKSRKNNPKKKLKEKRS